MIAPEKAERLNPLTLAFVGDSVQTLYVRTRLAARSDVKSGALHVSAAAIINASAQARAAEELLPQLQGAEADIYRRARNARTAHKAKNADIADYHKASGLEAVIGYLYLTGNEERLEYILNAAFAGGKKEDACHKSNHT